MSSQIKYKKGYKYQLATDYQIKIKILPNKPISTDYIDLSCQGLLTIKKGYAWDGASGAPDKKNIMRGALIHDALYQLLRQNLINQNYRKKADQEFVRICKQDGMSSYFAKIVYKAVQIFGKKAASHESAKKVLQAP